MYLIGSTHTVAFATDCQIEIFNGRDPCRIKNLVVQPKSHGSHQCFLRFVVVVKNGESQNQMISPGLTQTNCKYLDHFRERAKATLLLTFSILPPCCQEEIFDLHYLLRLQYTNNIQVWTHKQNTYQVQASTLTFVRYQ